MFAFIAAKLYDYGAFFGLAWHGGEQQQQQQQHSLQQMNLLEHLVGVCYTM
jgi:hypothetical protein